METYQEILKSHDKFVWNNRKSYFGKPLQTTPCKKLPSTALFSYTMTLKEEENLWAIWKAIVFRFVPFPSVLPTRKVIFLFPKKKKRIQHCTCLQDVVRFRQQTEGDDSAEAAQFFYLNPDTGVISTKKFLTETTTKTFRVRPCLNIWFVLRFTIPTRKHVTCIMIITSWFIIWSIVILLC